MILSRSLAAYMDQDAQKGERSVDEAIDAMKSRNDTQAVLFTCMFGENAYDYPSAYFRDSLLQLNPKKRRCTVHLFYSFLKAHFEIEPRLFNCTFNQQNHHQSPLEFKSKQTFQAVAATQQPSVFIDTKN